MLIEASIAIAAVSSVLSVASGIIVFLTKLTATQKQQLLDAELTEIRSKHNELGARLGGKIDELTAENRKSVERAHLAEVIATQLKGELALLRQTGESFREDVESIEEKMVTRVEWEPRMKGLEEVVKMTLNEVRMIARTGPSRYPSPLPAAPAPRPDRR